MSVYYVLGDKGEPLPSTVLGWAAWHHEAARAGKLHVADDGVPVGDGVVRVSTVFLGIDHSFGEGPPVLWEALVFGGPLDGEQERYTSRADAMLGHSRMLRRVMEAMS